MNDLPLIEELGSGHVSAYWQYLNMFVGSQSLAELLRYEALTATLGPMPGALGYFLRGKCYRWILDENRGRERRRARGSYPLPKKDFYR